VDLCEKKAPWGSLTMMKDVSLAKSGVTGEKLYYKVQDFVYDDVLFQYCQHKKVHKFIFSKSFENNYMTFSE